MLDNPLRGIGSISHGLQTMQAPASKPSTQVLTQPMKSAQEELAEEDAKKAEEDINKKFTFRGMKNSNLKYFKPIG